MSRRWIEEVGEVDKKAYDKVVPRFDRELKGELKKCKYCQQFYETRLCVPCSTDL